MKIGPKDVRFSRTMRHPWWRQLRFLPRGNSLQVQETGLVIEGYLQKLSLPIVDMFFRSVLSEWTTVTVPFSRILFLKTRSFVLLRVLLTLVAWLPLVFVGFTLLTSRRRPGESSGLLEFGLPLAALGALVTFIFNWLLATRHCLVFEEASGSLALVCFRIKKAKLRRRFVELIQDHRRANRGARPFLASLSAATDVVRYLLPLAVALLSAGMALADVPLQDKDGAKAQPFAGPGKAFQPKDFDKFQRPNMPAGPGQQPSSDWWIFLVPLGLLSVVVLPLSAMLAYQARQRGYHSAVWFLAGVLCVNPMIPLVVLALLPYRTRQALRLKEEKVLRDKLAEAAAQHSPALDSRPDETPPRPVLPEGCTATYPPQSLGDEVTRA
jgi:hypothetical protein